MKVIRVLIDKEKLLLVPEAERTFFLALGHTSNEINALTKMLYWAANAPARNDAEDHGRHTTMLLLIHLLAGKLNESWELFRKSFFGCALSRDYEPELNGEPAKALNRLKKYFGSQNSVNIIRNHFAFHYSPEEVSAMLPDVDEELVLYLERETAPNNLFYFAEVLSAHALLNMLPDIDTENPYDALVKELFDVSLWFAQATDGLMELVLKRHSEEMRTTEPEEVVFETLPGFKEVYIPWFVDTT